MDWSLVIKLLLLCGFCNDYGACDEKGNITYVIVTSDVITPNTELQIHVNLFKANEPIDAVGCTEHVRITVEDLVDFNEAWNISYNAMQGAAMSSRTFKVLIPSDESITKQNYSVTVESNRCLTFRHQIQLPVERKRIFISSRTDKKTYCPGEKIYFKGLVLRPDRKPYTGPMNVSIYDSNDVLLVRWMDEMSPTGTIRRNYHLSPFTQNGELRIVIQVHDAMREEVIVVDDSEKRSFHVNVRAERYHILNESSDLIVHVMASHSSGAPLNGKVTATIALLNTTKRTEMSPQQLKDGYLNLAVGPVELRESLKLSESDSLINKTVEVSVKVEELAPINAQHSILPEVHKGEMVSNVQVTFVDQSYLLTFHEFTPRAFKPGFLFVGYVELKSVKEFEFESNEVEVAVKVSHYNTSESDEASSVEELRVLLLPNSVGQFTFRVPSNDGRIDLEALFYDGAGKMVKSKIENILPFKTNDNHAIQVLLDQAEPIVKVEEVLKVKVRSSYPMEVLYYEVFSESVLVLSESLLLPKPSDEYQLSLHIPKNVSHLLSSPSLVVWTLSPNAHIIADSILFLVEPNIKHEPKMVFPDYVLRPGDELIILLYANPYSIFISYVAFEDLPFNSTMLEIAKQIALEKMKEYMIMMRSSHVGYIIEAKCRNCSTISSLASDNYRVLNGSRGIIFTNGELDFNPVIDGSLSKSKFNQLESIGKFDLVYWYTVGNDANGELKLHFKVDEKAGIYTGTGIASSRGNGIYIYELVQPIVTADVLATLKHPKSVVRGERFVIEVVLYNTRDQHEDVHIQVNEGQGFRVICSEEEKVESSVKVQKISIPPKGNQVVYFIIQAAEDSHRRIFLNVAVHSSEMSRNLSAPVRVKYEGEVIVRTTTKLLDNFENTHNVNLELNANLENEVENSERSYLKIFGDLMGPAIENICHESVPTLLEERLKIKFLQAVIVAKHISNNSHFHIHHLSSSFKGKHINGSFGVDIDGETCVRSIIEYVQNVLNKQRSDGSYSFHSNSPGYIWLTSMMLNSMVELRKVLPWYGEAAEKAIMWLVRRQREDGSFVEEKGVHVLSKKNKIDEAKNVPLTSQVLISLIRARNSLELSDKCANSIDNAVENSKHFIESLVVSKEISNDTFAINVAAYSLVLARSDKITEAFRQRDLLAVDRGDTRHWKFGKEESSLSVEGTAYGALTHMAMCDLENSRPIINWIISQMRPGGKFVSSEDTFVALSALSMYGRLFLRRFNEQKVNADVDVILSDGRKESLKVLHPLFVGSIWFHHTNQSLGRPVQVDSSGPGLMLVQSIEKHSKTIPSLNSEFMNLDVEVNQSNSTTVSVKVAVSFLGEDLGGFVSIEVPSLSGYELDERKTKEDLGPVLRNLIFNEGDDVYVFLLQPPESKKLHLALEFRRVNWIEEVQARPIRAYFVQEPDELAIRPLEEVIVERHLPSSKCQ